MNKIIISNSCVGWLITDIIHPKEEYNNPFIGTLIPNDNEYVKLCADIYNYIKKDPTCDLYPKIDTVFSIQNNGLFYKNKIVKVPYPIIHLGDIEIHCIHEEEGCEKTLEKFNRRRLRMLKIIENNNYKIFCTMAFSEIFNDHEDISKFISSFLDNPNNIFLGPSNLINHPNYICANEWNNVILQRDESHVYVFQNQPMIVDKLSKVINEK